MLSNNQQTDCDTLAGVLLRLVDERMEAGDRDGALIVSDAADALLALLDYDVLVRVTGRSVLPGQA